MAITCKWDYIIGTVKQQDLTITMYGGGNCISCMCAGDEHILHDFICDIDHLERVLGNDGSHWKTEYKNINLNGSKKEAWQIAKALNKVGITVTIYNEKYLPWN